MAATPDRVNADLHRRLAVDTPPPPQMGKKELMGGKDFYHVEVQSGYDQAFIIGVMAILDSIHGERHGTNRRHLKLSKADASRGYLLSENTQVSQLPACRGELRMPALHL
uniref:Uncharacterized protein n=1 Tax=Zea mays TaxID=4577 RepID=A0A804RMZ4_MAIZE